MNMDKTRLLAEMGIKPAWRLRQPIEMAQQDDVASASVEEKVGEVSVEVVAATREMPPIEPRNVLPASSEVASLGWEALEETVAACRACSLCERRKQTVFGVGDKEADWMFVGEGPGAEDDEHGEPFVGQAGKLLDAMLEASGMKRSNNVYIANAVKCRPPANRTPEAIEIATCSPYLARQIQLVKPKLLIALGKPAAQSLLGDEMSISSARGTLHRYGDIPVVVTYHPAYLLRNLPDKAKAWIDMCFAADTVAQQGE